MLQCNGKIKPVQCQQKSNGILIMLILQRMLRIGSKKGTNKESDMRIGEECKKISKKEEIMSVLNILIFNIIDVLNCVVIVCC